MVIQPPLFPLQLNVEAHQIGLCWLLLLIFSHVFGGLDDLAVT
jgi:hypothetical protein